MPKTTPSRIISELQNSKITDAALGETVLPLAMAKREQRIMKVDTISYGFQLAPAYFREPINVAAMMRSVPDLRGGSKLRLISGASIPV